MSAKLAGIIAGDWWYCRNGGRVRLFEGAQFVGWLDSVEEAFAHVADEIEREAAGSGRCTDCGEPASTIGGEIIDGLCRHCAMDRWGEERAEGRREE